MSPSPRLAALRREGRLIAEAERGPDCRRDETYLYFGTLCAAKAIEAERAAVLAYAGEAERQIDGLLAKRRLSASEAALLKRRLRGFAEGVAAGLHLQEGGHGQA